MAEKISFLEKEVVAAGKTGGLADGGADAEEEGDVGMCIICYERLANTVIMPCKHLCICAVCSESTGEGLTSCPVCRHSPIEQRMTLFLC